MRAARVRHLRRAGRKPPAGPAQGSPHAGGDHAAHGAARAERRAAEGDGGTAPAQRPPGGDGPQGRGDPARDLRGPRHQGGHHPPRHPGHALHRFELLQGAVRRGRPQGAAHLRAARAGQGHRVRHRGAARDREAASERGLSRAGGHPSPSRGPRGRELPPGPGAAGRGSRGQGARDLLQPLRLAGRPQGVHRRDGHLPHALSQRGPDHLGHPGLCLRRGQGGGLHALLARAGTARRRTRHPGALPRSAGHRRGRVRVPRRSGPPAERRARRPTSSGAR